MAVVDAQRFAEHLARWADAESEVEVLPGELPDVPGVQLPAIKGEVVGSIVRRALEKIVTVEVHYIVAGAPVKTLDQLEATLKADGFEGIPPRRPGGGFQALPAQWDWTRHFARRGEEPYFSAFVRPIDERITALWLKWEGQGGWHPSEMRDEPRPMGFQEMPTVSPPEGVLVAGTGGGGNAGGSSSDALVITSMSLTTLHDHAAAQLQAAGWKRHRSGDGELAWSTWELPKQGWTGLLAIFALPTPDQRAMLLRIWSRDELESAAKRMSGWRPLAKRGGRS